MDDAKSKRGVSVDRANIVEEVLKSGLAHLEASTHEEYAPYRLPRNPFPFASVALAETAKAHPPLRLEQVRTIGEFLKTTLSTGRFAGLWVVGDYGFGKTHILRWLEHSINSAGQGQLLAIYVQNPGTTPREFVTRFTASIGLEELRKRIWIPLLAALREEYGRVGDQLLLTLKGSKQANVGQIVFSFDEQQIHSEVFDSRQRFMSAVKPNPEAFRQYCVNILTNTLDSYPMARALTEIAIASEPTALRAWTSITSVDKSSSISYEDQFRAILRLLAVTGVKRTFLLFDELEDITSARLSKRHQAEYAAVLKMLIDQNLDQFALAIAVTENGLNEMKRIYPPLAERMTHTVALLPLSEEDATYMVEKYLSEARKGTTFDVQDDPLFPFDRSAISAIISAGIRNPRAFLGFCHRLLSWAVAKRIPVLNAAAVESYLQEARGR